MMKLKLSLIVLLTFFLSFFSFLTVNAEIQWDVDDIFINHNLVRIIVDIETQDIVFASKSALDYYGYTEAEIFSLKISDINILSPAEIQSEIERAVSLEQNFFQFKHRLKSGEIRDVNVYSYPFTQDDREYLYSTIIDVTSTVKQQRILIVLQVIVVTFLLLFITMLFVVVHYLSKERKTFEYLANHDILTGARSRLYFEKISKDYIIRRLPIEPFAFVILDIDQFKTINDLYGHVVGDEVLKYLVKELKNNIGMHDTIYRYGGDEFILFIALDKLERDIEKYMRQLRSILKANSPFEFEIRLSFGVELVHNRSDFRDAIRKADSKMYKMKNGNS